jgi:hypothetical protein
MKNIILGILTLFFSSSALAQKKTLPPSKVNYAAFLDLAKEVQPHRNKRVVHLKKWIKMSKDPGTIILDTRSKKMYDAKHIKGAIHLNFADFNMKSLYRIAPNKKTRILIYCNNNIDNNPIHFASKVYVPTTPNETKRTLALNVPTFINLYGYGYKNVYELADLVSSFDRRIEFEGTAVPK